MEIKPRVVRILTLKYVNDTVYISSNLFQLYFAVFKISPEFVQINTIHLEQLRTFYEMLCHYSLYIYQTLFIMKIK